jgi:5'-deoxynucleotidase YfbR-like HD superfamily hydrolase
MRSREYYENIYRLRFVTRYSNRLRTIDEDVAQHSFFVAAIILRLHDIYDFDLGLALIAAVSHDIMESDLSDVTHDIKERYPRLRRCISEAEQAEIVKYPRAVQAGFSIFEHVSTVEGLVANLADVLQVVQYVRAEESLGNSTLSDVKQGALQRATALKRRLAKYERGQFATQSGNDLRIIQRGTNTEEQDNVSSPGPTQRSLWP